MKNKYLVGSLLCLLGKLPKRMQEEQLEVEIYCHETNESITINELVKRTIKLMKEGMKGKEEEEE